MKPIFPLLSLALLTMGSNAAAQCDPGRDNAETARGLVFLDVGASWFNIQEDFTFWQDGGLKDAVGAFGGGVYFDFFGLPLNFYLSQKTDFNSFIDGLKFDFYIGPTF